MLRNVLVVAAAGAAFWVAPASARPSTFQNSCSEIALDVSPQAVFVTANCRKRDGRSVPARFEIKGIANMPEGLRQTSEPHSSYQRSCTGSRLRTTSAGVTLIATCQDGRGGTRQGMIAVNDIHNNDGVLVNEM